LRSQIGLGRVFGIKVGLHYSWFLIALLLVFSLTGDFRVHHPQWGQSQIVALAVGTAVLFFASLLLHELSHSLMARQQGMPVREITLFALGGVSQIEGESTSAKNEFEMALAGPLTSVLIGLACLGAVLVLGAASANPLVAVLTWLGYINLGLAAFNMLPGYPLDGGRILRAVIWWKTGDGERATRMAAKGGQAVAAVFIGLGIIGYFGGGGLGALWISFIGWFLLQAAGESYVQSSLKRALEQVRVGDVMTRDCPVVDGGLKVQEFVDHELLRTGRRCFIVTEDGGVAGLVTPNEIKQAERAQWPFLTLHEIMRPRKDIRSVSPETPLNQALEVLGREDLNQLPVLSDGHVEGILSRAEVLAYLQTRAELQV
jgi:Zn-dependent protease/predicted transcriptional regulator